MEAKSSNDQPLQFYKKICNNLAKRMRSSTKCSSTKFQIISRNGKKNNFFQGNGIAEFLKKQILKFPLRISALSANSAFIFPLDAKTFAVVLNTILKFKKRAIMRILNYWDPFTSKARKAFA